MATMDANQPTPEQPAGVYQSDPAVQASKRTSIGLTAHRATARESVQRPPNAGLRLSQWWLVMCLIVLLLAVGILTVARTMDPNTTWETVNNPFTAWFGNPATGGDQPEKTVINFADRFDASSPFLATFTEPDVFAAAVLPALGVYRMDVWPNYLGWSRISVPEAAAMELETTVAISPETPDAAAGIIGRFADKGNLVFFAVDGRGNVSATQWVDNIATPLPVLASQAALNPAGSTNRLRLDDNGSVLRFYGNGTLLAEVAAPRAETQGAAGIGAQATSSQSVTVDFLELIVTTPSSR